MILAGVVISTLTGDNGLLKKATDAKIETIESEELERIKLAVMASHDKDGINITYLTKNLSEINGLTDIDNQSITENTEITLPEIVKLNNLNYEISVDGEVYKYYNMNGLLVLLDGINNTRNGHSTTTMIWEDLSGNNNDFTKLSGASNAQWSDNSYIGNATNRTLVLNKAILENANEATVEVCYDISQLSNYYWIFQNRQVDQPSNGFQFWINNDTRNVTLWTGKDNSNYNTNYNSLSNFRNITNLGKRTMAFAVDSNTMIFSDNNSIYTEETKEGALQSLTTRNCYSIGSAYPWRSNAAFGFEGNIYSIRVYNRKLSEEELKNNYEVDRVRFNMD